MDKRISTAVYSFERFIENDYFYVDKTLLLYELIEPPVGIYFLSRPRRFGKSLTISTLKCIFEGRRDLFKGLEIEKTDYNWKEYPVIHIDMGSINKNSPIEFVNSLCKRINMIALNYDLMLPCSNSARDDFESLIFELSKINKVVILIDEYDKPILDHIGKDNVQEFREILESFYEVIKGCEHFERFVFMTGVTKVSKVSIFSKLNNLTDISMDLRFATLLGYTQEELETNFAHKINSICTAKNIDKATFLDDVKNWYNGYKFNGKAQSVYNPVSVGEFFNLSGEFQNFWFRTETPSFLMKLIKSQSFDLPSILKKPTSVILFDSFDLETMHIVPLLIQTGYLTIVDYKIRDNETLYFLGFPNKEVELSFQYYLLDTLTSINKEEVGNAKFELCDALIDGDIEQFIEKMKWFYCDISYELHLPYEKYYQTIFFTILRMMRFEIEIEVSTNIGRIDAVVTLKDRIYLMEFKLDDTAQTALEQIESKRYYEKYLSVGLPIHLVGIGFSYKEKNITGYVEKIINIDNN